jgi:hypothetical protein
MAPCLVSRSCRGSPEGVSPSRRGLGVSPRNTSQGGRVGIDRIVFED